VIIKNFLARAQPRPHTPPPARGVARNLFWGICFWGGINFKKIRSITIKTAFLLHKNLPGLILGGYIYRYTPRRYGPACWRHPAMSRYSFAVLLTSRQQVCNFPVYRETCLMDVGHYTSFAGHASARRYPISTLSSIRFKE